MWSEATPTSRAHASGTMLERSSGSKPLSPGIVPSSAGAAGRKGMALDFSCDAERAQRVRRRSPHSEGSGQAGTAARACMTTLLLRRALCLTPESVGANESESGARASIVIVFRSLAKQKLEHHPTQRLPW